MKKNTGCLLAGMALCLVSAVMLLMNLRVSNMTFYSFGRVNSGGVLLVLFVIAVIWVVVKGSNLSLGALALVILAAFVSLLAGTRFYLTNIDAFQFILMVALAGVGLALIIKAFVGNRKSGE